MLVICMLYETMICDQHVIENPPIIVIGRPNRNVILEGPFCNHIRGAYNEMKRLVSCTNLKVGLRAGVHQVLWPKSTHLLYAGGFLCYADGFLCYADGFLCYADGFLSYAAHFSRMMRMMRASSELCILCHRPCVSPKR